MLKIPLTKGYFFMMKGLDYDIYFNNTSKQFDERGFECILAVFLVLGSLFLLLLFPIMGFALSAFAYGFLCIGAKSYFIGIATNKYLPIESIFSKWKLAIKAFCLKAATMLLTALWTLVFIVPGIITALNFSMASFIMAEDNKIDALGAMIKSKNIVKGYRGQILIVYLCYILVSVICLVLLASIGAVLMYYFKTSAWVPIIAMGLVFLFIMFVLIIPYFELGLTNVYLTLKKEYEKQNKPKSTRKKIAKSIGDMV